MPRDITVCVIGAGVCGIVSVKACLDSGFDVTCYDKTADYGGLWNYRDDKNREDVDFTPSVMRTTILNTSKELSAFSDFPPPAHLPNFMKHNLYMDYIKSYVEHFKVDSCLQLEHQVLSCEPVHDPVLDSTTWSLEVRNLRENKTFSKKFDKLMIAIGHHNIPHTPILPEQHKFKGKIIHSARLKDIITDERFVDKNVLVVGLGNSACDAANDIAIVAKKCYVSSHRGQWFVGRLSPTGLYDFEEKNRWAYYKNRLITVPMDDRRLMRKVQSRTNHKLLGLSPKHKPSELFPAINDLFPYRIFTGGITLKSAIEQLKKNSVIFEGEPEVEYNVDIIVLATGYKAEVPFIDERKLGMKHVEIDEYDLYLNMFAPNLSVPGYKQTPLDAVKSLAFIGLVQPAGSITVISELQARMATLVFGEKCNLPSVGKMRKHNEISRSNRSSAVRSRSKDQLVGNWIFYLDELASKIGVKPPLSKLFFKDFPLWKKLIFGPSVSYQYRLFGPGSWSKARETILEVDERVYCGINEGKNHILSQTRHKRLVDKQKSVKKG